MSRIIAALSLASVMVVPLWTAEGDFKHQMGELQKRLRAGSLPAEAIADYQSLLAEAEGDWETEKALSLLIDAQRKAGLHQDAVGTGRRLIELAAKTDDPFALFRAYNDTLKVMRDASDPDGQAIIKLADEALEHPGTDWDIGRRLKFHEEAARGAAVQGGYEALRRELEQRIKKAEQDEERHRLRILLQQQALREDSYAAGGKLVAEMIADPDVPIDMKAYAAVMEADLLRSHIRHPLAATALRRALPLVREAFADGTTEPPDDLPYALYRLGEMALYNINDDEFATEVFATLETFAEGGDLLNVKRGQALVFARRGEYEQADTLMQELADLGEGRSVSIDHALLVLNSIGDRERGMAMLDAALADEKLHFMGRIKALEGQAERALARGDREEAIAWYLRVGDLPGADSHIKERMSLTYLKIGNIIENTGDLEGAKQWYRKALANEQGDEGARVRARNAIEEIEYFE
jgi:tetratricopeptide (TPR) repeat protein